MACSLPSRKKILRTRARTTVINLNLFLFNSCVSRMKCIFPNTSNFHCAAWRCITFPNTLYKSEACQHKYIHATAYLNHGEIDRRGWRNDTQFFFFFSENKTNVHYIFIFFLFPMLYFSSFKNVCAVLMSCICGPL